jgi:GNAT superfamily N-acetyltransferase
MHSIKMIFFRTHLYLSCLSLWPSSTFGAMRYLSFSSSAFQSSRVLSRTARIPARTCCDRFRQEPFNRRKTACHLFFRRAASTSAPRHRTLKAETLRRIQSPNLSLPFVVEFDEDASDLSFREEKLTVRHMRIEDIQRVMPICIEEFGQGPSMTLFDFPFYDFRKISNWWDRVYFEPSVTLSLRSKIAANLNPGPKAKDPTVLVLCRRSFEQSSVREDVIGMVEISLQVPEADKNPPQFPVPSWFKAVYGRLKGNRLQGWVTNLLIDPRHRGCGYSKILMAATEGIAKSWGCHYIYLHADADYRSGKTAQSLYKGLGYEVVTDQGPDYAWMLGSAADSNPFSSIRVIEGVPLLCFSKRLQV